MPDTDLLDVCVWLALTDENHAHHPRARQYWESESAPSLAFVRASTLGLLRLLTNRTVMQHRPFTPAEAWAAYRAFRALPEVTWIDEGRATAERVDALLARWIGRGWLSPSQWMDAHLAGLALVSGCRLVSFDGGFHRYDNLAFLKL